MIRNCLKRIRLDNIPPVQKAYVFLYQCLKPNGELIQIVGQNQTMFLDPEDTVITPNLLIGCYEDSITGLFRRLINEGDIVVDAGAHIGYYSLLAAGLTGKKGKVLAFEPAPDNYSLLLKNVEANKQDDIVVPINKALSDRTGATKLFLSRRNAGGHRIYDPRSDEYDDSVQIDSITLDEFYKDNSDKIGLIKIDVEGAECAVIRGMSEVLKRNTSLKLIIEFWPMGIRAFGYSPEECLDSLVRNGFEFYLIGKRKGSELIPIDMTGIMQMCPGDMGVHLFCRKTASEEARKTDGENIHNNPD